MLTLELRTVAADRFLDRERRLDGPQWMILEGDGGAKKSHQTISEVLIDGPFVAMHGLGDEPQDVVHQLMESFRINSFRAGGIGDVGKEDGDEFALAFEGAARRENFFLEVGWRVCPHRPRSSLGGGRRHHGGVLRF